MILKKYLKPILFLFLLILFFFQGNAQEQWNHVTIYRDIPYFRTSNADLKLTSLDIYQPENCVDCPVIVYIHGGTWVLGDKGSLTDKAKAFTENQFIYISINYRLSPDVKFPVHIKDVAQAIRWIYHHIRDYGGNPNKIYLLGHSAGGHLAALVVTDEQYLNQIQLSPSIIQGIIGLDSAAYHLPTLFKAEPQNLYLFEWAFGSEERLWEIASPINYIKKNQLLPSFLLLVAGDRSVSQEVNQNFYRKLIQFDHRVQIVHFDNKDHISIDYDLGRKNDPVFPLILNWIDQNERSSS
jgi:acetyl esterase/lipase